MFQILKHYLSHLQVLFIYNFKNTLNVIKYLENSTAITYDVGKFFESLFMTQVGKEYVPSI